MAHLMSAFLVKVIPKTENVVADSEIHEDEWMIPEVIFGGTIPLRLI